MSLGNTNEYGNKTRSNYNWQSRMLETLRLASSAGLATEATLLAVLAALQNGQEFEQNLVMDTGGAGCPTNCPTYLQIRIYNTETHTFDPPVYYDAIGAVVIPVGPLQLVNPQYTLQSILTQDTAINTVLGQLTDAAVSTDANGSVNAHIRGLIVQLIALSAKFSSLGQNTMANSQPVTIASNQSSLPVTPAATENHLGSIGGNTGFVASTITMSVAGSYSTGDYIGTTTTPQAFSNPTRLSGSTGIIKSIIISDKNTTAAVSLELWLFSATFVAPTDNAAWAITDTENLTCLGVIPIDSTKWYASSNNKMYTDDTRSIIIKPAATSLFYALVARGTTPTWVTGDLTITLGILQD